VHWRLAVLFFKISLEIIMKPRNEIFSKQHLTLASFLLMIILQRRTELLTNKENYHGLRFQSSKASPSNGVLQPVWREHNAKRESVSQCGLSNLPGCDSEQDFSGAPSTSESGGAELSPDASSIDTRNQLACEKKARHLKVFISQVPCSLGLLGSSTPMRGKSQT
jgi:hypothetical protein